MSLFNGKAGEAVIVETRKVVGETEQGNDKYETTELSVDYVLVSPGPRTDIPQSNRPNAHLVRFTLHFPKTFDHKLAGCRIKVRDEWYRVVGSPEHYDHELTPGAWSLTVEVEDVRG